MMADDALAFLAEAFGHYSEAELQDFLDATAHTAVAEKPAEAGIPAAARLVREGPIQAPIGRDRPQAA